MVIMMPEGSLECCHHHARSFKAARWTLAANIVFACNLIKYIVFSRVGTVTLKRTFYSTQHAIDLAPLYKHENTIEYSVVVFLLYFCCCHSFSSLTYCNCILWASRIPVTPPCVKHLCLQGNAESVLMLLTMMGMLVTGALQGFRPWLFALWGWLQWFIVALVWHCCNCQMCI